MISEVDKRRFLCEKVVKETWSNVGEHLEDISKALEKKTPNKSDIIFLKIAARALVQKLLLERVNNMILFGMEYGKAPCGDKNIICEECHLSKECSYLLIT